MSERATKAPSSSNTAPISKDSEPEAENTHQHRSLRAYTAFHATQIDGIAFPAPALPELPASGACDLARDIVAGMPKAPPLYEGTAFPCYRQKTDSVQMPERRYFDSEEAYYSTLFHELTHATGHRSRLARKSLLENTGMAAVEEEAKKTYAEEELVAEMGASFLSAHAGITEGRLQNSAAYLSGWIDVMKSRDVRGWIIRAAAQAQKAADFILNL